MAESNHILFSNSGVVVNLKCRRLGKTTSQPATWSGRQAVVVLPDTDRRAPITDAYIVLDLAACNTQLVCWN